MNIGKLIHDRRIELGLTLEEVGKAVGVGKSTVKKWEDGFIANMRRDKIATLSNVLSINPVSLISGTLIEEKQISKIEMTLTPHEIEVITAYRAQPEMQIAVDRTLGITSAEGFSLPEENLA
mgnify:CR=1 FL=1